MKGEEKRRADIPVRYCANETGWKTQTASGHSFPPGTAKAGWKTQTERGHSCPPDASKAGWKTRPPVIEAEARETDKALKEILEKLGV